MPRKTKEIEEIKEVIADTKNDKKNTSKKTTSKSNTSTKSATSSSKSKKTATKTNTKSKTAKTTSTSKKTVKASKTTKSTATKKKTTTSAKKTVSKRATRANSKKVNVVEYYDLPYRYNQTVVKVLAQTPNNLFIYWDISDKDREKYKKQYGDNFFETTKPVLIVHNDTLNYSFEVDINDFANSWYLHINDAKCDYRIELGRRPIVKNEVYENVNYIHVSTSNEIESPNDHILFAQTVKNKSVSFRNVKTGNETIRNINISSPDFKNMGELYNIYELYKAIYQDENIEELYDLSNPSSGNPSSGNFRLNHS